MRDMKSLSLLYAFIGGAILDVDSLCYMHPRVAKTCALASRSCSKRKGLTSAMMR